MINSMEGNPSDNSQVAAIILAYNEEKTIYAVLEDVMKEFNGQIIVVNDGSSDNTENEIKKIIDNNEKIHLLNHIINLGPFTAIHTGIQFGIKLGCKYFINIDGDGQHPPEYISKLLEPIFNEKVDLVIGSRFLKDSGYSTSVVRNFGIKGSSKAISIFSGTNITDVNSGYRAYNLRCAREMLNWYNKISTVFEFTLRFCKLGYKVKEIPVEMKQRKFGESYLSFDKMFIYPFRIIYETIKALT